jgi:hypothetical protein
MHTRRLPSDTHRAVKCTQILQTHSTQLSTLDTNALHTHTHYSTVQHVLDSQTLDVVVHPHPNIFTSILLSYWSQRGHARYSHLQGKVASIGKHRPCLDTTSRGSLYYSFSSPLRTLEFVQPALPTYIPTRNPTEQGNTGYTRVSAIHTILHIPCIHPSIPPSLHPSIHTIHPQIQAEPSIVPPTLTVPVPAVPALPRLPFLRPPVSLRRCCSHLFSPPPTFLNATTPPPHLSVGPISHASPTLIPATPPAKLIQGKRQYCKLHQPTKPTLSGTVRYLTVLDRLVTYALSIVSPRPLGPDQS